MEAVETPKSDLSVSVVKSRGMSSPAREPGPAHGENAKEAWKSLFGLDFVYEDKRQNHTDKNSSNSNTHSILCSFLAGKAPSCRQTRS